MTAASCGLLIGPSGLGKTHLSVALGTKMVQLGYSVRFVVAQQLANAVLTAAVFFGELCASSDAPDSNKSAIASHI